jgi:multidrug efflux pump subunit AcrA (membrane-fusion protein)
MRERDEKARRLRFKAKPRGLVPLVEPETNVAQMLYELKGSVKGLVAKDQQVIVYVPMSEKREQTTVPYSAIVFDAYGSSWIYLEKTPPSAKQHVFERRRIELGASRGDEIDVILSGLTKGDNVVTEGAQVLFSREFHKPPVPKGVPKQEVDDDD